MGMVEIGKWKLEIGILGYWDIEWIRDWIGDWTKISAYPKFSKAGLFIRVWLNSTSRFLVGNVTNLGI
jgi:hypothetical protein